MRYKHNLCYFGPDAALIRMFMGWNCNFSAKSSNVFRSFGRRILKWCDYILKYVSEGRRAIGDFETIFYSAYGISGILKYMLSADGNFQKRPKRFKNIFYSPTPPLMHQARFFMRHSEICVERLHVIATCALYAMVLHLILFMYKSDKGLPNSDHLPSFYL